MVWYPPSSLFHFLPSFRYAKLFVISQIKYSLLNWDFVHAGVSLPRMSFHTLSSWLSANHALSVTASLPTLVDDLGPVINLLQQSKHIIKHLFTSCIPSLGITDTSDTNIAGTELFPLVVAISQACQPWSHLFLLWPLLIHFTKHFTEHSLNNWKISTEHILCQVCFTYMLLLLSIYEAGVIILNLWMSKRKLSMMAEVPRLGVAGLEFPQWLWLPNPKIFPSCHCPSNCGPWSTCIRNAWGAH